MAEDRPARVGTLVPRRRAAPGRSRPRGGRLVPERGSTVPTPRASSWPPTPRTTRQTSSSPTRTPGHRSPCPTRRSRSSILGPGPRRWPGRWRVRGADPAWRRSPTGGSWSPTLVEPGCGAAEIYDPATGSFTKTGDLPPLDTKALARLGVRPRRGFRLLLRLRGPRRAVRHGRRWGPSRLLAGSEARRRQSPPVVPVPPGHELVGPVRPDGGHRLARRTNEIVCTKSYSLRSATLVPLADGRVFVVGGSIPSCDERRAGGGATS